MILFDSMSRKATEKTLNKRAADLGKFIRDNLGDIRLQGLSYGPHQMTGIRELKAFWGKGAQVDVGI
jgi:hypothetical protein